jgi:hypothetical protein
VLLPHEQRLRNAALGLLPEVRLDLLRVLAMAPDDRARAIATLWARPETREHAELLMDLEESPDRA